jgi:hypothetical protein
MKIILFSLFVVPRFLSTFHEAFLPRVHLNPLLDWKFSQRKRFEIQLSSVLVYLSLPY